MKKLFYIIVLSLSLLACDTENPSLQPNIKYTDGVIDVLIKVSPTKSVKFSQGNLQYHAADNTWRFAEKQWDISSNNKYAGPFFDGWIDQYMWAANGYDDRANDPYNTVFQPWATSTITNTSQSNTPFLHLDFSAKGTERSGMFSNNYYLVYNYHGVGPTLYTIPTALSRNQGKDCGGMWLIVSRVTDYDFQKEHDWGSNTISNGGSKKWRTLTKSEWEYMLQHNIWSSVTIHGVRGYLIAPEEWNKPESIKLTKYNQNSQLNRYSEEESDLLLKSGVVFLPSGSYWTATTCNEVENISSSYTSTVTDYWTWHETYLCTFSSYAYAASDNVHTEKRSVRNFVRLVCEP